MSDIFFDIDQADKARSGWAAGPSAPGRRIWGVASVAAGASARREPETHTRILAPPSRGCPASQRANFRGRVALVGWIAAAARTCNNSRFGAFNSRLGWANSRFGPLRECSHKRLIYLMLFVAKARFARGKSMKFPFRREKPGISRPPELSGPFLCLLNEPERYLWISL
jgi:hypothetical protein